MKVIRKYLKKYKLLIIAISLGIILLLTLAINQILYLKWAHSTFESYYTFRGCTKLLQKTGDFGICETSPGTTVKIVKFDGRWFLDGDLPCGFLCW